MRTPVDSLKAGVLSSDSLNHVSSMYGRKANLTLKQSLELCRRRRPIVDPIPAFLDQLTTYERECRALGYLTAVDAGEKEVGDSGKDTPCVGFSRGDKRKADDKRSESDQSKKKKAIGPMIDPSTAPNRGPVRSAAIGPARDPQAKG